MSIRLYFCDAYIETDDSMEACWNRAEYRVADHTHVCGQHIDAGVDLASCYQDAVPVTELATGNTTYVQ